MSDRSLNVLLVDDDAQVLSVHEHLLRHMQHQVISLFSPVAALKHIEENIENIDIIITDFRMPEMDGAEFIAKLRKLTNAPVIVVTGYANDAGLSTIREAGISILNKPVRFEVLKSKILEAFSLC